MATENLKKGDKVAHNATINLKATKANPHREEGEVFEVHPVHREKLIKNKWAVEVDAKDTDPKSAAIPEKLAEEGTPGGK